MTKPTMLRTPLANDRVVLRLLVKEDFEELFLAASDPAIWEQHPQHDRYLRPVFAKFFEGALEAPVAFVVQDAESGRVIGSSRYYELTKDEKEKYAAAIPNINAAICIGYTFLIPEYWGGTCNHAMKRLMIDHAFRLFETVVFQIGANNKRSRMAIERIGGVLASITDGVKCEADDEHEHVLYYVHKSNWL